mmetsp:Transcript_6666/g.20578  ORF Transcript_6666/g.20578 Transcript_6666/m.20578 type:complete len:232 (+) Transcript_6666:181-876(+)
MACRLRASRAWCLRMYPPTTASSYPRASPSSLSSRRRLARRLSSSKLTWLRTRSKRHRVRQALSALVTVDARHIIIRTATNVTTVFFQTRPAAAAAAGTPHDAWFGRQGRTEASRLFLWRARGAAASLAAAEGPSTAACWLPCRPARPVPSLPHCPAAAATTTLPACMAMTGIQCAVEWVWGERGSGMPAGGGTVALPTNCDGGCPSLYVDSQARLLLRQCSGAIRHFWLK